jgi:uncharacterized protein YutE (UPF0331/DUF86 family)
VLLETSAKKRLTDAHRHLEALEAAVAGFGAGFDAVGFEAAWLSSEPAELHRAYAVQAGYENVINTAVAAGRELCELKGWITGGTEPSSIDVLRLLHENGIIGGQTRQKLRRVQELRNRVQHDYANVGVRQVHEAVGLVLEAAPLLIQDAALALRSRGDR